MHASISVVMPFYKNERTLVASLHSFAQQQHARACEIIVVDDGGPVRAQQLCDESGPFEVPVSVLRTDRAGQSGATNAGIRRAQGEIVLLSCADIIASPKLLAEHLKAHAEAPHRAVLGRIPYAAHVKMTPFMQFLRTSGVQFDFEGIVHPDEVDCLYLYAPNVSVRASELAAVGGFDEAFTYGYQDTDLGLRLEAIGVQLVYRELAVGYHDHPNEFTSFVDRQQRMGEAAVRMLQLHKTRDFELKFTTGARYALPRLKLFDALLADAQRIEAAIARRPILFRSMRQDLFRLYGLVLLLAVFRGALRKREAFPQPLRDSVEALLAEPLELGAAHLPTSASSQALWSA